MHVLPIYDTCNSVIIILCTKLRFCSLLKGGLLSVNCWGPTTDTVIFEFYCDTGAGCDTDVQFWYRLTPSPVGAGEESLNEFVWRHFCILYIYILMVASVAVLVWALVGTIFFPSFWTSHFTLTVPLSTQVYKWVPPNLMLGVTLQWTSISSRGK